MKRAQDYGPNQKVWDVELNLHQDLGVALRPATQNNDVSAMTPGAEERLWQATADLATATLAVVDDGAVTVSDSAGSTTSATVTWYDRIVWGLHRGFAGADQRAGQASDYAFDAAGAPTTFLGYTGLGAKDAGNANVSAGNPPVPAAGASWAVLIDTNLWLYVDPGDGKLKIYNNTGSTIRNPLLWLRFTSATGKRP